MMHNKRIKKVKKLSTKKKKWSVVPSCPLLFVLLTIYYLLNVVFPESYVNGALVDNPSRIYPQILMGLIFIYCCFFIVTYMSALYKFRYNRAFIVLILLMFFYAFLPSKAQTSTFDHLIYFMKSTMAVQLMLVYFLVLVKNGKEEKWIYIIFFVQVAYALYNLYFDYQSFQDVRFTHDVLDSNSGFILASCLPLCFLLPQKRLRVYVYFIILCATMLSGQRSAALAAAITIPFAFKLIKTDLKRIDYIFFILFIIVFIKPMFDFAMNNLLQRHLEDMARGADAYGGGRATFWVIVWDSFWNGDSAQMIFGRFYDSVPDLLFRKYGIRIYSHNGWLDMLYMFGFIGFFIYLKCYLTLYKANKKISRVMPEYKHLILMMLLILILKSSTSHGNFDISYIPFFSCLSIIFAHYVRNTRYCENTDSWNSTEK
jgi:hypothetical protein